jgi:hypothetical protein
MEAAHSDDANDSAVGYCRKLHTRRITPLYRATIPSQWHPHFHGKPKNYAYNFNVECNTSIVQVRQANFLFYISASCCVNYSI